MHRDLKLENIMMKTTEDSVPKLVDFGLSKIISPLETVANHSAQLAMQLQNFAQKPYSRD